MKHVMRENSNRSSWRREMDRWKRKENLEDRGKMGHRGEGKDRRK